MRFTRPSRRTLAALLAPVLALSVAAVAGSAAAQTPPGAVHPITSTIEGLAPYVPQDDCDPHIKPGTAKLGALLSKLYPGISWSSTRACDASSVSEHQDGRAIDWMASVRNPAQKALGLSLAWWFFKTDVWGHQDAPMRRLGVMYVIYNGYIRGTWDNKWDEYDGCHHGVKATSPAYDDECHRSHVHISLSWNGAMGRTSYWTGAVSPTDYGPCRAAGKTWAPVHTAVNLVPCARH